MPVLSVLTIPTACAVFKATIVSKYRVSLSAFLVRAGPVLNFTSGLRCPHKEDCHHVLVVDPALTGRRLTGPLFVLTSPVWTLTYRNNVAGTIVFARQ